jgi:hypothetical protein
MTVRQAVDAVVQDGGGAERPDEVGLGAAGDTGDRAPCAFAICTA